MDYKMYYLLVGLAVVYIAIKVFNSKSNKRRKSRRFMEKYERKNKQKSDES